MASRFVYILKSKMSLEQKIAARHASKVVTAHYRKSARLLSKLPALDRNYKHYETHKVSVYLNVFYSE